MRQIYFLYCNDIHVGANFSDESLLDFNYSNDDKGTCILFPKAIFYFSELDTLIL